MSVSAPDPCRSQALRARALTVLNAARGEQADFALCPLLILAVPSALAVAGLEGPTRVGPLTAILGGLASVAVAILVTLVLVRVLDVLRYGWLGTVAVWAMPGLALGVTRAALAASLGDPYPEWGLRTAASVVASLVWVPIVVATVHLRRELAVARASFRDAEARLSEVLGLEADARRLGTDEVSGLLATRVIPGLDALAAEARAAARDPRALAEVRERTAILLDTVVRPLSRELGPAWPGRAPGSPALAPMTTVLHDVLRRPVQAPWSTGVLITASSGLDVLRAAGWDVLLNGLGALVVACAVLDIVRALTARSTGRTVTAVQWAALLTIGIGVGLVPPLVDALSPQIAIADNLVAVFEYLPLVALGSVATSALRTHAASSRSAIDDLATATGRLEMHIADIARRTGRTRPRAVTTLHGAVQSRLAATVLALSRPESIRLDGTDIARELSAASRDLARVEGVGSLEEPLERLLALPGSWRGVLDVRLDLAPVVLDTLRGDTDLCETVTDVVRECAVNAAKHGRARQVRVLLETTPEGLVLAASDDAPHPEFRRLEADGVTARAVHARGGTWSVTTSPDGALATVVIPRSPART